MTRIIDPKIIKMGYKSVRKALSKNPEIARKIKKVEDWKTITENLDKSEYKYKGTTKSVKEFIGDAIKGRIKGIDKSEAVALARGLTGGKYIITSNIESSKINQASNQASVKPTCPSNPIMDRVIKNIINKRKTSLSSSVVQPSVRPNIQSTLRSQRGISSISVSARSSKMFK